jgi:sulfur-oxidizing protein SoxX
LRFRDHAKWAFALFHFRSPSIIKLTVNGKPHSLDVESEMPLRAAVFLGMGMLAGCAAVARDAIEVPLAAPGDAARGREVFVSRDGGHCVLCHSAPGIVVAGNVGPPLAGVGARLSAGQIRLRIADITRVNPDAAMPAFHRTRGSVRVAAAYAGRTALDAQQVEDLVAFLGTLK